MLNCSRVWKSRWLGNFAPAANNIYVDLPDEPETMLLVHGYSGAYDKVARHVATYVRSLEVGKPPRPLFGSWTPEPLIEGTPRLPAAETIAVLRRRGYLTTMTASEEESFFSRIAMRLHHAAALRPSYIFMPTYDCNLRCFYCFQDHMRTNPRFAHLLKLMTPALVDRIFEAIPRIEERHGLAANAAYKRTVGFFGGEPLLAANRGIVEYIINKALSLGPVAFWAVSNGTDLDAYADLLRVDCIDSIQITLDGPPAEHDKRRIYADGRGSFERIAEHITMALDRGISIQVRMNIDRLNVHQLPELADEIVRRGWPAYRRFSAYTAPIRASNEHTDAKTTFSSWELDRSLDALRQEYPNMRVIDRPDDRVKRQARAIFEQRIEPQLRADFCGAQTGMYIFDYAGDIYACWERTGEPQIRVGRVTESGDLELAGRWGELWRSRNVTTNPICRKCRYALYCGGGCAILAEGQHGEINANYCDGFAARFRAHVAEAYVDHAAGLALDAKEERVCDL